MTLVVNGEPREVNADTLTSLLATLELDTLVVATAVNGVFVPKGRRSRTELNQGDRIEILAPMQGG